MSRTSLLTSALAALALGAGAMGLAATRQASTPEPESKGLPAPAEPVRPPSNLRIEVAAGEGLAAALLRAGVGGLDAALAQKAGEGLSGPAELWLGSQVGPGAHALERLELRLGAGRKAVLERQGDSFVRRDEKEAVDPTPVRVRLGGTELVTGLVETGLPRGLRDEVLDQAAGKRVAAIDLIVEHESGASGARYGDPLYLGIHLADGSIRRWLGARGRLQLLGSEEAGAGLLRPLPGPVTSNPGLRFHPILRYLRWHRGTDFASPAGTPVQAAETGRVIDAGWQGGYGRIVRIAHRDGTTTLYAHLSGIDVADGQPVARGAVIGTVGSTGLATGPHLHFEWQRGAEVLRPDFKQVQVAGSLGTAQQAALRALLSAPFKVPPGRRS
jgi:murein DD-endopeptidase MepM/ murein hydrolase activator NlpD